MEVHRAGAQKIGLFPSPTTIFILSSLSLGSSRGTMAAVQGRSPAKVHVWVLWGHFVLACRLPGLHTMTPEKGGPADGGREAACLGQTSPSQPV